MTIRIIGRSFLKEFVRGLEVINYEHVDTKGAEKHEVPCMISIHKTHVRIMSTFHNDKRPFKKPTIFLSHP